MLDFGLASSISRRGILAGAAGAISAGWLPRLLSADESKRPPKSCILLWLDGGPSQTHTFSIPEKEPDYKSIKTQTSGIEISEYLPQLATMTDDLTVTDET